jgi:tRNA modification GTPase
MFSTDDSIVAIATPPGRGGIGIVRLSGPASLEISTRILNHARPLEPRHATFIRIRDVDEVIATYFPAPQSYTGEHVVEISAHGSPVVLQMIVAGAIAAGARLAEPGEFTLRAFLNGKRDLVQAEAVADLIAAATPSQARVAFDQLEGTLTERIAGMDGDLFDLIARLEASLDFPDEGYHFIEPADLTRRVGDVIAQLDELLNDARAGRLIREGATVVVAGRPNVGKSSLFNLLAGAGRAIVTPVPGTTRDLVSERVDIKGLEVALVDTAGWRETQDVVEREGVARSRQARVAADLVLLVLDCSEPISREDEELLAETAGKPRIVVVNKVDLPGCHDVEQVAGAGSTRRVDVCARTGAGLDDLRRAIVLELTGREALRDTAAISNARHIALLEGVHERLESAQSAAATAGTPEEFVLADLQAARVSLDEVVGTRTSDDLLRHIFDRFCIGK